MYCLYTHQGNPKEGENVETLIHQPKNLSLMIGLL